jgi:hypothetical protein
MTKKTKKEEELLKEGWQRRFIASEPRVSEMKAMYEETGFEVHLEPLAAGEDPGDAHEECEGCRICFTGREDVYQVIYTRRRERDRRKKGR